MKNLIIIITTLLLLQGCFKLGNNKSSSPNEPAYSRIDSLITPTLSGGKNIESSGYSLRWSRSKDGCQYEVEESTSEYFYVPFVVYLGANNDCTVQNSNYYRVRAVYQGFVSNWSNVVKI